MKTGDRVICINDSNHTTFTSGIKSSLKKGREYIIYSSHKCVCGRIALDAGIVSPHGKEITTCMCGADFIPSLIWWCDSKRFRKVQEKREYIAVATNVEIEEPIEN